MFGIGLPELLIILAVALIVVGPRKLPDLARGLGKGLQEFRKATDEIKSSLNDNEVYQDFQEVKSTVQDTVKSMRPDGLLDVKDVLDPKKPQYDMSSRQKLMEDVLDDKGSLTPEPEVIDAEPVGPVGEAAAPDDGEAARQTPADETAAPQPAAAQRDQRDA